MVELFIIIVEELFNCAEIIFLINHSFVVWSVEVYFDVVLIKCCSFVASVFSFPLFELVRSTRGYCFIVDLFSEVEVF